MPTPITHIFPFDALKYIGILIESGFPESQAKALSEAQKNAFLDMIETTFPTKRDITPLNNDLFVIKNDVILIKNDMIFVKNEAAHLRADAIKLEHSRLQLEHHFDKRVFEFKKKIEIMQNHINTLATKMDLFTLQGELEGRIEKIDTRIARLEEKVDREIARLEAKICAEIIRLEEKFDGKFKLLHWMLGFMLSGMIAILSGTIGILFKLFQF